MKKLLITGFDAFVHYQINPSWEAVKSLPEEIGPFKLTKMRLPNIYGLEWKMLLEKAQQIQPDVILLTGMDSGSTRLHLDTVAINLRDALVEDNLGRTPWNEAIIAGGPTAYFATLPVHDIIKKLQQQKIPVHIGYASGGYVCNDVFYLALHHFAATSTKVGFLHVPLLPEMVWDDSLALPLDETLKTLKQIIICIGEMLER